MEANHRPGVQQTEIPIVIEMVQVIIMIAHLHIHMEIDRMHARPDEELHHLLGIEEVGILQEGMKDP